MRAVAIVANLLQMVIVLLIFTLQGLTLGGWTVFLLFILLIVAAFNLLTLLFQGEADRTLVSEDKPAIVKRQDLRVVYTDEAHPMLALRHQEFSLLDLAESGARIRIDRRESLKKRMRGSITLLCGDTLDIKASLLRRQGDEAALRFRIPIGYAVLLKEKKAVSPSTT